MDWNIGLIDWLLLYLLALQSLRSRQSNKLAFRQLADRSAITRPQLI